MNQPHHSSLKWRPDHSVGSAQPSEALFLLFFFLPDFELPRASLEAQRVKHLPARQETRVRSLGQEDPLEKEMTTPLQYSCLENPMDGGACRLQSRGSQRVGHD